MKKIRLILPVFILSLFMGYTYTNCGQGFKLAQQETGNGSSTESANPKSLFRLPFYICDKLTSCFGRIHQNCIEEVSQEPSLIYPLDLNSEKYLNYRDVEKGLERQELIVDRLIAETCKSELANLPCDSKHITVAYNPNSKEARPFRYIGNVLGGTPSCRRVFMEMDN